MLSLAELRRAARVLGAWEGDRLQALAAPAPARIELELYRPSRGGDEAPGRRVLLLSCEPGLARVSQADGLTKSGGPPPAFLQYLRAHVGRARLTHARIVNDDRQLALGLATREASFELLLSVMGARSNLYLLDAEGVVRAAARPLPETRRDLAIGDAWRDPERRGGGGGEDRFAAVGDEALLREIEGVYRGLATEQRGSELSRRVAQVLRKERSRLERKRERLEGEAASGERAGELQRQGELLKTVLDRVAPGADAVVARDFESGDEVRIELDPKLSARANLERLFKRYHKAVKRAATAGAQLGSLDEEHERLARIEEAVAQAEADEDPEALEALAGRDDVRRLLARYAPQAPPKQRARSDSPVRLAGREVPARLVPKRYRSRSGLEIWVGKSDAANDFLTTRLARGNDLFFHLEDAPGSHVILRTEGRTDPPSEAVLDACELAVHFSKQRRASRACVDVVPIKNV